MEQAKIDLIVIDAKLGDEKAFEQLFLLFQQSALRYSYKVVADPQLSQEATQNSWMKIAKNLSKLNDPRAFKSWLFKVVRWQTLDLVRKQQSQGISISIDDIDELEAPVNPTIKSDLSVHISELEDIDKQAIHLFYLEDLSLLKISLVLSTPIGTVKSRLNRARNSLRSKLTECGE